MEVQVDGQGQTSGEAEINIYDFQSNWDDVAKERQRQEDQQERIMPGPATPVSPPHSPDARNLRLESVGEDEYGGNDMIIWRDEGFDPAVEPNPYEFDWGDAGSDEFLP